MPNYNEYIPFEHAMLVSKITAITAEYDVALRHYIELGRSATMRTLTGFVQLQSHTGNILAVEDHSVRPTPELLAAAVNVARLSTILRDIDRVLDTSIIVGENTPLVQSTPVQMNMMTLLSYWDKAVGSTFTGRLYALQQQLQQQPCMFPSHVRAIDVSPSLKSVTVTFETFGLQLTPDGIACTSPEVTARLESISSPGLHEGLQYAERFALNDMDDTSTIVLYTTTGRVCDMWERIAHTHPWRTTCNLLGGAFHDSVPVHGAPFRGLTASRNAHSSADVYVHMQFQAPQGSLSLAIQQPVHRDGTVTCMVTVNPPGAIPGILNLLGTLAYRPGDTSIEVSDIPKLLRAADQLCQTV